MYYLPLSSIALNQFVKQKLSVESEKAPEGNLCLHFTHTQNILLIHRCVSRECLYAFDKMNC